MKSTTGRQEAISAVINYKPLVNAIDLEGETSRSLYGSNVFSDSVMKELLSRPVYKALRRTIERGEKLDYVIADAVATAMKGWALEKGATHFTHVFLPAYQSDRGETRQLFRPGRCRRHHRAVLRQRADPGRARRLQFFHRAESARPLRPAATRPGT